jgi:cytochrome P450
MSLANIALEYRNDVASYYRAIHEFVGPAGVRWDPSVGAWLVTKYALCSDLLAGPELRRQVLQLPRDRNPDLVGCAEGILNQQLMFSTGTQSRREYWQRRSAAIDNAQLELIAASVFSSAHEVDLYSDVLQPYASRVAAACIGLDEAHRQELYPYVCACVRFFDGKLRSEKEFDEAMYSIVALYDRLGVLYRDAQKEYEVSCWIADLMLAFTAAHESTAYLLGTAILHEQARQCSPVKAILESLRFDSPVQVVGKTTSVSLSIGSLVIPPGSRILIHIGAANRDPTIFEQADSFSPSRSGPTPLSFGQGDGICPGRNLALRSATSFLTSLQTNKWWFDIEDGVRRTAGVSGRGFETLRARRLSAAGTF